MINTYIYERPKFNTKLGFKGSNSNINGTTKDILSLTKAEPNSSKNELEKILDFKLKVGFITPEHYNKIINGRIGNLYQLDQDFRDAFNKFNFPRNFKTTMDGDLMIFHYSQRGCYKLNETLRNEKPLSTSLKIFKDGLDEGLDKLPDYKGIVYRSSICPEIDALNPGDVYKPKQYISASKNIELAEGRLPIEGCLFVIKSKTGKFTEDIKQQSNYEKEVLFKPTSSFKLLKKTTEGDNKIIYLEEISEEKINKPDSTKNKKTIDLRELLTLICETIHVQINSMKKNTI